MSLHEKTQRQLIRNRVSEITDMAQDINLAAPHVAPHVVAVTYQPYGTDGFHHSLRAAIWSPGRGRKTLEVELPTADWSDLRLETCLSETEYLRQQLRELMPREVTP